MTIIGYSHNESLERIYHLLRQETDVPVGPGVLPYERIAWNESLERILQLLLGALGGEQAKLPASLGERWQIVTVPMHSVGLAGGADPDWGQFREGDGTTGTHTYLFDGSSDEEAYFEELLPPGYKSGQDIYPYILWGVPLGATGSAADDDSVVWDLEYALGEVGSPMPAPLSLVATGTVSSEPYMIQRTALGIVTGSHIDTVTAALMCRLSRDASDGYSGDVAPFAVAFHYLVDDLGSLSVATKT